MPRLTVSAVVPTYNRASLLEKALRTALAECEPGDEIIVVDDGSTDGTEAVVRGFGPAVRYLRSEHVGAGAARNIGIAAATCDLVAFLDSDDEWVRGKLSWQRAVFEHFPEILFVFSDFGRIAHTGDRLHGGLLAGKDSQSGAWDTILGDGLSSATIPGLPASAPPFGLHIGRLYEMYIHRWCVFTSTVVVRRVDAGDALRFAEDVPTYEDLECYARLAGRGLAGFMDCETAWQRKHAGPRLTDADRAMSADTAVKIIDRVWGVDDDYLRSHRDEFETVMDGHRGSKVRYLLRSSRRQEARQELGRFFHAPLSYYALTYLPSSLMRFAVAVRGRLQPSSR